MNQMNCERVRELIPLSVAEALEPGEAKAVALHLEGCAECRGEAELVRALYETRPVPPAGLVDRIEGALRFQPRAVRRPWWGLAAAAVAVLALGIGVMGDRGGTTVEVPIYVAEAEGELWLSDDGLIAGAASLDDLSDEALEQLLSELAMGGAA